MVQLGLAALYPKYAVSQGGVLSQVGALAISRVGSGCKSTALGRVGHQQESWEQLLTSASLLVSAGWLTKPPFEGECLKSRDTSSCGALSEQVGCWSLLGSREGGGTSVSVRAQKLALCFSPKEKTAGSEMWHRLFLSPVKHLQKGGKTCAPQETV